MTVLAAEQIPVGLQSTDSVTATKLPVLSGTGTYRTLLRLVVNACVAGDVLDVDARARLTNDVGYTVGVGWHLWLYDVDAPEPRVWRRMGPSNGDNVPSDRHHMPLHITAVYQMPADWPAGHRPVVVLRGDAHSTAARDDDELTVDPIGVLTVRRWTIHSGSAPR